MQKLEEDQIALQEKQLEVKEKKAEVEDKKKEQEKQKASLQSMKATLDEQKEDQDRAQRKLAKAYEEMEEYAYSLEEEAAIIAAEASALDKAKQVAQNDLSEKERQEKAAQTSNSGGTSTGANSTASAEYFIFPTTGGKGDINSPFRPPHRPTHNGIDIAKPAGTPAYAGASGVAYYTVTGCKVGNQSCGGGYGNHVRVLHQIGGESFVTVYAHLSSVGVSEGETVSQGQYLGGIGNTGHSFGNHLHFEVHPGGYKNPKNPVNYLK